MAEEKHEDLAGDIAVERSIDLAADPATVWEHLTEGDLVSTWMGADVTIEPRRGGAIGMTGDGTAETFGVVEEIIPERRLQWSWRTADGMPALVEIDIEPDGAGTRLTVRETLLPWQVTEIPPQWHVDGPGRWYPASGLRLPTSCAAA
jgi:uncharacterized protein YndB with AHSA1/START domain